MLGGGHRSFEVYLEALAEEKQMNVAREEEEGSGDAWLPSRTGPPVRNPHERAIYTKYTFEVPAIGS